MAVEMQYLPSAQAIGRAANIAGAGELARWERDQLLQEAQFAEGVRQFDVQQSLNASKVGADQAFNEQKLAADMQNAKLERDLNAKKLRLQQQQIASRAYEKEQALGAQLATQNLRGQYGLADQAMRNEAYLEAEALSQQGMAARQQNQLAGQRSQQWQQQALRAMEADRQAVQKALPRLDESERQELLGKFYERWEGANVPLPMMEQPELPDWMNPEAMLNDARTRYPDAPWHVDPESGTPALPRGWNYQMSESYQTLEANRQARDHQNKLELEAIRERQKTEAAAAELRRTEDRYQREASSKASLDALDAWHRTEQSILGLMPKRSEFEIEVPIAEGSTRTTKKIDEEAFQLASRSWADNMRSLSGQYNSRRQSLGAGPGAQDPPGGRPSQQGLGRVDSAENLRSLIANGWIRPGDWVQTPDGPRQITDEVMRKLGL